MLEIRLLGPLEVLRDGRAVPLPRSRKCGALLAYLVATERPHTRASLCDLLWEGPADPRAELRWALTRLRPLLNEDGVERLRSVRQQLSFDSKGATVDLVKVWALVGDDPDRATTEALEQAASSFRGEFLDGLDVSGCYRWEAWRTAERESMRVLHGRLLMTLSRRLADEEPERGLAYARSWVVVDPLSEAAHAAVIRLLSALGRTREALAQYEEYRRIATRELRRPPGTEIEAARQHLPGGTRRAVGPPSPDAAVVEPVRVEALTPLAGRQEERVLLERVVRSAASGEAVQPLLLIGEPGIGKTRLLEELAKGVAAAGGITLRGRAFEAESVRPYGAWTDALRSLHRQAVPPDLRPGLTPLLPELVGRHRPADRTEIFDAVVQLLIAWTAGAPVALVLDDIQWLDEASVGLLHYVARELEGAPLIIGLAARTGELEENAAASALVRALRREARIVEVWLGPLPAPDIERLVRTVDPDVDGARVARESEGNPLFALEVARALSRGGSSLETLDALIDDRLGRIGGPARDTVGWAATLGRSFSAETLGLVTGFGAAELVAAIEELERHGVIRPATSPGDYDFAHDLVRRVTYERLSEPRRRYMHLRIARTLDGVESSDASFAGDVAHHAALGGDPALAARASIAAGDTCLRVFGYREAAEVAKRGLRNLPGLPAEPRLQLHLDLLRVYLHAGAGLDRLDELSAELSAVIVEAQQLGLYAEVQRGFELVSYLHWKGGDFGTAAEQILRCADASRAADPATTARGLAASARCLAHLERELPRARAMTAEARALAERLGLELTDIPWAVGQLEHFEGRYDEAIPALEKALSLARRAQDHWPECDCLARMALIELERGRPLEAQRHCRELLPVAGRMGEGSEGPFAVALDALVAYGLRRRGAARRLAESVRTLHEIDSNVLVAYVQTLAAEMDLDAGRVDRGSRRAAEALRAAEIAGRRSQVALARSLLARAALARGDPEQARSAVAAVADDLAQPEVLSWRARQALFGVLAALDASVPTSDPTPAPTPSS